MRTPSLSSSFMRPAAQPGPPEAPEPSSLISRSTASSDACAAPHTCDAQPVFKPSASSTVRQSRVQETWETALRVLRLAVAPTLPQRSC